ncbi:glycosyltransferase [Acetobacteraceae bacterium ESL0697]|nr:glycosyltransferase [Acetobacteraceae bacterium ESL0697]
MSVTRIMKIHYLVKSFEGGGTGFAMIPVLQMLREAGYQIDITACRPGDMLSAQRFEAAGFPCHTLFHKPVNKAKIIWKFITLLKKTGRPDIIMTSLTTGGFVGQIVGKLLGIPVISWKHSANLKRTTARTMHFSKLWIADSPSVGDFVQNVMKIPPSKIIVWPLFCCEVERGVRKAWTGVEPLRIGSIGRLDKIKNYPLFLEGIALFRETYPQYANKVLVSILGEGPDRLNIEKKIRDKGLEKCVKLLGYSPDVYNYLNTLDLYAQPSEYEGMCMAAHEALSTGLPLLATPVGEMQSSLKNDVGFVLDGDIPWAICNALKDIFEKPALLEEKSQNALDYTHRYYSKAAFEKAGQEVLKRIGYLIFSEPSRKSGV